MAVCSRGQVRCKSPDSPDEKWSLELRAAELRKCDGDLCIHIREENQCDLFDKKKKKTCPPELSWFLLKYLLIANILVTFLFWLFCYAPAQSFACVVDPPSRRHSHSPARDLALPAVLQNPLLSTWWQGKEKPIGPEARRARRASQSAPSEVCRQPELLAGPNMNARTVYALAALAVVLAVQVADTVADGEPPKPSPVEVEVCGGKHNRP